MLFEQVLAGQRFKHEDQEYLKIAEIKKSCCQILANAVRLRDNKETLFAYKTEVEVVAND